MALFTFGINHKTAPIAIRERVAFTPDTNTLQQLITTTAVKEVAILSTCNRSEIYCDTDDINEVGHWFSDFHKLSFGEIKPYSYIYQDQQCIRHILRVAGGLDSLILGESQILGQLKNSAKVATIAKTLGKKLHRLFQHSFMVAKQIRTDTAIGSSPVSVAFAAVALAKQIFGDISNKTAMLIGAGETIELVARHLYEHNIGAMIIANRSSDKAANLADSYNGQSISLPEIANNLHKADIVISSTSSPLPVIGKGVVESALKKRKRAPVFMVDIAVPRDIEVEVNNLADVFLYTVDDLQDVIDENMQSRKNAAIQAEEIIDVQVMHFWHWLESQNSISTIQHYRHNANKIRQNLLDKAKRSLVAGHNPEQIIETLAHRLTNQLLHDPCAQLRLSKSDQQAELVKAAKTLFNLQ